jgi:hypothetical protein
MPKPKQQRRLLVGIVLDRSSSMSVIVDATISNTNEQFSALRDSDDAANTFVAFNTFANTVTPVLHDGSKDRNPILVPVNALEDISDVNYRPSGMTAMYDGVDAMITFLSAEAKHNDDVMVVVISDGAENASRNITSAELASKINANQDLTQVAADLGIHVGNMLSFQAHDAGVDLMGNTVSTAIRSYAGNRSSHIASGNDTRLSTKSLYSPENVKDDGHVVGDTVEGSTTLKTNPDVVLVSSEDEIA